MKKAFLATIAILIAASGLYAADPAPATTPAATDADKARELKKQASEQFASNFKGAFSSYHTDGIDAAMECYKQILELKDIPAAARIDAWRGIADCHFERMEVEEANAALASATKLPGLEASDLWTARKNQAEGFYRQLDYAEALKIFETLWTEDLHIHKRQEIERRITSCLTELGRVGEIVARMEAWKRDPIDLAWFKLDTLGDTAAAQKLAEEVLKNADVKSKSRISAAELLLMIRAKAGDTKGLMAEADRIVPVLVKDNPGASSIYRNLSQQRFSQYGLQDDPEFTRWQSKHILELPNLPLIDTVKQNELRYNEAVRNHDLKGARAEAEALLAREGVPDDLREKYSIALAMIQAGADPRSALKGAQSALDRIGVGATNATARADGLLQAAKMSLSLGFDASAKAIFDAREKMRVRQPLRSISCTYIENGPSDITEFLNSTYFKDAKNRGKLDRKYGENLQFLLETDAALRGRKVTDATGDFKPTEFVATCDADGLKLFFFAYTTPAKAREIAEKLSTLGGYEMYLAAGPDAPYHCYLFDQVPGKMSDFFVTQYDNAGFRCAQQRSDGVTLQHRVLKNGVATLMSFSWASFFNRVPVEGEAWSFEAMHWEQGGYSWGGSESVHNRSSFGSLIFTNMTDANRRAIKRRLIPIAAAKYKRERSPHNGQVEIWGDPELGDREFNASTIVPLQKTLDAYLELVKPDMTDADVDMLFEKAVPQWMNIRYVVASLRRDELVRRRVEGR